MTNTPLDLFFKPSSVAIIGASVKPNSIGRVLLENLKTCGFPGKVYPVNPKYTKILDYPAYPDIVAVAEPIDLAVIAVPIPDVPDILKQCGQAEVRAAIIISSGGGEIGEQGPKIE